MMSLSVVVVMLAGKEYLSRCLQSLMNQRHAEIAQIIVPFDQSAGDLSQIVTAFPSVTFEILPGKQTFAELRAAGFRLAKSDVIALTEDHCIPDPDWCKRIVDLHRTEKAVAIGGAVEKEGSDSALNWAVYLCDFSRYMNPLAEGPADYLTDCNVSYKREPLVSLRQLWEIEFHETTVHWAFLARGETIHISPDVIVRQQRSLSLQMAVRERYNFGRLFASTRAASASAAKRFAFACGSIFLPLLLSVRILLNVLRKRRHISRFLLSLMYILLLNTVWAAGEFAGYITGHAEKNLSPASKTV